MLDYIKLACYNGFKLDKQAKNDKQKVSSSKVFLPWQNITADWQGLFVGHRGNIGVGF